MFRTSRIPFSLALLPSLVISPAVLAAVFPDVADDHIYHAEISALVAAEVINGNPDGFFYPDRAVNRAEMLKMLYRARGKMPDPSSVRCFPDVVPESWYETYVCDAEINGFIDGNPDGTFRPEKEVNRVEAIKMILNVFEIDVAEVTSKDKDVIKFVDVSTAAWYTKYLYAAFSKGILPIRGQTGARFYPDWPLFRGEAAAYIYNSLNVSLKEIRSESQAESDGEATDDEEGTENTSNSEASSDSRATSSSGEKREQGVTEVEVDFPFEWSGKFSNKKPVTFLFDLLKDTGAYIDVALSVSGTVTCRLYKLEEGGFSNEYYLGHQEETHCYIHAAVPKGSYQLQIQPTVANATFHVTTEDKKGDGSDGFREAGIIIPSVPKSAALDINDIQDWYMFIVKNDTNMTVELTNAIELDCIVYPGPNVDLFSFEGPECNQTYRYTPGSYYVSVFRKIASKATKKTYTIQLH